MKPLSSAKKPNVPNKYLKNSRLVRISKSLGNGNPNGKPIVDSDNFAINDSILSLCFTLRMTVWLAINECKELYGSCAESVILITLRAA